MCLLRHNLVATEKAHPAVLHSVRWHGLPAIPSTDLICRADLSRSVGLARVMFPDPISELLERGHLIEPGKSERIRPVKPAIMVGAYRKCLHIIGLELADNSVLRAAVLDLDGNILRRVETLPAEERGAEVTAMVPNLMPQAIDPATAPPRYR